MIPEEYCKQYCRRKTKLIDSKDAFDIYAGVCSLNMRYDKPEYLEQCLCHDCLKKPICDVICFECAMKHTQIIRYYLKDKDNAKRVYGM